MTDDSRPDPDALLSQMRREEDQQKKGRLFILLGMGPGVGKTYAMLLQARQRQLDGLDVLAGIVETHGRPETAALLDGLEIFPRKDSEFDLDAALIRRPDLLLVDELAHTNSTGSRHLKRYQDVLELLDAGVDVITTLNVQHIDSQADIVRQVTGVTVHETVPDSMLDRAHEIQLIDLSVGKLLARLHEGKVYPGERAEAAKDGFFKEGNLTALRDLALRFTAERADRDVEEIRKFNRISSPWKTNARLMVAVGPTPYSESLIRWTRRASGRHGCPWIAVWVERTQPLTAQEQELLGRSLNLVRRLGGEVVHAMGESISEVLLDVARERNVSQIIVGKTSERSRWKASLADRIINGSGDIDVCVVRPVLGRSAAIPPREKRRPFDGNFARELTGVLLISGSITALCWWLEPVIGYTMPAMVYLLGILLAAFYFGRWPVLIMAAVCAACWNFFFISPKFTFEVRALEDMFMLAMFFAVALSMGSLTNRLRKREIAEHRRQIETEALLRVTQSAALAPDVEKGLGEALRIIGSVVDAKVALIVRKPDHSFPQEAHPASHFTPSAREFGVAGWAFANKQIAGRHTDTLPQSAATWFPLLTATSMMGVLGIERLPEAKAMDFTQRQAVEAFALQLALVLEKEHFIQAVAQADLMEKSERLRRNLLDSVSHELKTPLAVIRAAIDGMGEKEDEYVQEIDTATKRLQRLVDGLLQMTRLESQVIEPQLEWCDVSELIDGGLRSAGDAIKLHPISKTLDEEMPLVKTDPNLLMQSLANILHNAAVYSQSGKPIEIFAVYSDREIKISVRDHGPGLPVGDESKVFGKFYRTPGSPAGGTGLGLSIARGFIQALGGEVVCRNHPDGGAVFEMIVKPEVLHHGDGELHFPGTIELGNPL